MITDAVSRNGHEVTLIGAPVVIDGRSYSAFIVRDVQTSANRFAVVDAITQQVFSAEVRLDNPASGHPRYEDLVRYNTLTQGALYQPFTALASRWAAIVNDATSNTGLWYLPAIVDINEWYRTRVGFDPATTPLAILAVSAPIDRFSEQPAILNTVAGSGNTPERSGWVAASDVTGDPDAQIPTNAFRVQADVTLDAEWTATLTDPSGTVVSTIASTPGQVEPLDTVFFFTDQADPDMSSLPSLAKAAAVVGSGGNYPDAGGLHRSAQSCTR